MGKGRFYWTRLEDYLISTNHDEDPDYPLANLKTYLATDEWRSSSNAEGQYLAIDFGQALLKNFIIIENHNLDVVGPLRVRAADDEAFTLGVTTLVDSWEADDDSLIRLEFDEASKRYWRIEFLAEGTLSEVPRIGQIYLGYYFEFTFPEEYGAVMGDASFETNETTALSGLIRGSQEYAGRLLIEMTYVLVSTADRDAFRTFFNGVRGKLTPFYYLFPDDETLAFMLFDVDVLKFKDYAFNLHNPETLVMKSQRPIYGEEEIVPDIAWQILKIPAPEE
jgi:hypothetical protein